MNAILEWVFHTFITSVFISVFLFLAGLAIVIVTCFAIWNLEPITQYLDVTSWCMSIVQARLTICLIVFVSGLIAICIND